MRGKSLQNEFFHALSGLKMKWTIGVFFRMLRRNPKRQGTAALVRLRWRSHSGVEVPVRPLIHRPVTEGYCAVATRGGELPEVNCQSVTMIRSIEPT
jgi:hypothetical protein